MAAAADGKLADAFYMNWPEEGANVGIVPLDGIRQLWLVWGHAGAKDTRLRDGIPIDHRRSRLHAERREKCQLPYGLRQYMHSLARINPHTWTHRVLSAVARQSPVTAALHRLGRNCFHLACQFGRGFSHLSENEGDPLALMANLQPPATGDTHTHTISSHLTDINIGSQGSFLLCLG